MGRTSVRDAFIIENKYWINNNQWGISGASGSQFIWGTCQTGDLVGWGTSWNWSGGTNGVKTFASLVYGWQWGWRIANTGLPVPIATTSVLNCGWSFNLVNPTGTFNVVYDMWLTDTATPTSSTAPTEEVMVWLYAYGGAGPLGTLRASNISIAGATWNLHFGLGGSTWNVASYVRTSNTTAAAMNMMLFYQDLVTRNLGVPNTRYLASIQAGTEVFTGAGQLDTLGFYCR